jgi:hypothetical protein
MTPLQTTLGDDGIPSTIVLAAETLFGSGGSTLVLGAGLQTPSALATSTLPSLTSYRSERALRYDELHLPWSVARIFAEDGDQDSDAIELVHAARRGFYAQFLCDLDTALPRTAVLLTTLAYAWAIHSRGSVEGLALVVVLLALLMDLGIIGRAARERRKRARGER